MPEIVVDLPTDRTHPGTLTIQDDDGNIIAGPFDALGKSDNQAAIGHGNPTRDPTQPYGDTPTGGYNSTGYVATGDGTAFPSHSYGPNGAIVLDPTDGQAQSAEDNGRTGLLIHGGDPGSNGALRPTYGCIRLSNGDMAEVMKTCRADGNTNRCTVAQVEGAGDGPPADEADGGDAGASDPPDVPPGDVLMNPPGDVPPADEPPADEPPADEPPADEPPADEPPADEPPADEPPEDESQPMSTRRGE
jgi:hypothetical protein